MAVVRVRRVRVFVPHRRMVVRMAVRAGRHRVVHVVVMVVVVAVRQQVQPQAQAVSGRADGQQRQRRAPPIAPCSSTSNMPPHSSSAIAAPQ